MKQPCQQMRLVALSDGTGMGDALLVFQTNAPVEELQSLEELSCNAYIDGNGFEDVPIWAEVLEKKGYLFECIAEHQHVSAYDTSDDWLKQYYPSITEQYVIDNQPELSMEM